MHTSNFAVLLLSFLGLLAYPVLAGQDTGSNGLAALNEHPTDLDWIAPHHVTASEVESYTGSLVARGRSRSRKSRKNRKNEKAGKDSKNKETSQNKKKGCPGPPRAGKGKIVTLTKHGKHSGAAKRDLVDSVLEKRTDNPAPESVPQCRITQNYHTLVTAAEAAGAQVHKNGKYILVHRTQPSRVSHATVVYGKVKVTMDSEGYEVWDFRAGAVDLHKDTSAKKKWVKRCKKYYGAACEPHEIEAYSCSAASKLYPEGEYMFAGTARPEFGLPEDYRTASKDLIAKHPTYSVFFNDCHKHIKRVVSIAAMDKSVDPAFPGNWDSAIEYSSSSSGGGSGGSEGEGSFGEPGDWEGAESGNGVLNPGQPDPNWGGRGQNFGPVAGWDDEPEGRIE